jgi:hypothetical protein
MDKMKISPLVLAALLLAALLSLFLAYRYGGRTAANPAAPAAPAAAAPPARAVKALPPPTGGAAAVKRRTAKKPVRKRDKRVSALRDPGEALMGGVSRDTAPATSDPAVKAR